MSQGALFADEELVAWKREWQNMPEFSHEDLSPRFSVIVNFACEGDVEDFARLIGQSVPTTDARQMKSFWYPDQEIGRMVNKRYIAR